MADKISKKEASEDPFATGVSEEGEELPADPYLNELDSSLEDLAEEEPTDFDSQSEDPADQTAPLEAADSDEPVVESTPEPTEPPEEDVDAIADIPIRMRVVVGDKNTTLADLLNMKTGEVMELDKGLDTTVDLMVQDKIIARGELVEVEGRLGVRVLRVFSETKPTKVSS